MKSLSSFEDLDLLQFWNLCGDAGFNTTIFVEAIQVEIGFQFTESRLTTIFPDAIPNDDNDNLRTRGAHLHHHPRSRPSQPFCL